MFVHRRTFYCLVGDKEDRTEEERARAYEIHAILDKMEREQEEEDTEMLIRLVKLRKSLWT